MKRTKMSIFNNLLFVLAIIFSAERISTEKVNTPSLQSTTTVVSVDDDFQIKKSALPKPLKKER